MGHHTFDSEKASSLERAERYRYLSRDELLALLAPTAGDVVADLGSGTGFYTDDVAPYVEKVYGVDLQEEMHDSYREKGVPDNVELVTANVSDLPMEDDALDSVLSTMTFHEFAIPESLSEISRVLRPGGRVVIADWGGNGEGESGPPTDHRFHVGDAAAQLSDAGFAIERAESRRETFVVVARND
jgi:ubiquinone/menaquinone biosynthesis C-methylase UbiE